MPLKCRCPIHCIERPTYFTSHRVELSDYLSLFCCLPATLIADDLPRPARVQRSAANYQAYPSLPSPSADGSATHKVDPFADHPIYLNAQTQMIIL